MQRKMIFFDIDGTLLDHQKQIPDSTRQAVKQLQEAGHEVAIATGRAPFMFKHVRDELGIDSFVSLNGQYVVYRGEPIHLNPLHAEELQQFVDFAAERGNPIVCQSSEGMRLSVERDERFDAGFASLHLPLPDYEDGYHAGRDIFQVLLFCKEKEEHAYRERFGRFDFVRWHEEAMDVLPKAGSKAAGIDAFIRRLGIGIDDVYAFGDYYNDLEMLQFVGHGVAMGNAPDDVKRVARYVTEDVGRDGIAYGLKMVGLL